MVVNLAAVCSFCANFIIAMNNRVIYHGTLGDMNEPSIKPFLDHNAGVLQI
jgi:hypothetical protein